jgi:hypothetical protein
MPSNPGLGSSANWENNNPGILMQSVLRVFKFLPGDERSAFLDCLTEQAS